MLSDVRLKISQNTWPKKKISQTISKQGQTCRPLIHASKLQINQWLWYVSKKKKRYI